MLLDQIGDLIKEYRERYNISQEDLAFDLCAVSTLSHIESGEELPGQELVDRLLGRLGLAPVALNARQEKKVFDRAYIGMKIAAKEDAGDFNTESLLSEYKSLGSMTDLETQYFHYHNALRMQHAGEIATDVLAELYTALGCTVHIYNETKLPLCKVLSSMELKILYESMFTLRCIEKKKALVFAEYLGRYLENNIVKNEYAAAEIAPSLFQHLTQLQLEAGRAEEALATAEKGIAACSYYGKLFPLPHLVQAKGKALSALGRAAEAQKALGDAKAIFTAIERAKD